MQSQKVQSPMLVTDEGITISLIAGTLECTTLLFTLPLCMKQKKNSIVTTSSGRVMIFSTNLDKIIATHDVNEVRAGSDIFDQIN